MLQSDPGRPLPDVRTLTPSAVRLLDEAIGDVDWTALPAGAERVVLPAPSGGLAGVVMGEPDAPRIVLVPGVTGSKEDFALMLPLLAAAGYRVLSYDLAGQYESHEAGPERLDPPRPRYDWDLFVDDLVAVIGDGGPTHLLGYSFAGTVAALTAVRRPELVASLTMLSTPPLAGQVFRRVKHGAGLVSRAVNARGSAAVMLWGIRNNLNRAPEHRLAFVRERFALTRRSGVDEIMALMRRSPDLADELRELPIPKLVAYGAHDLWSSELHAAYAERIGAEAVEYDTGHSPCETAPHQLAADLLRVVESGRQRPAG